MSEFYIPPIDDSLNATQNSQVVVAGLGSERSGIESANSILHKPVGIASTAISRYQVIAKQLDLELLNNVSSILNEINSKKLQIVEKSQLALVGFVTGINPPICEIASDRSDIDSPIVSEKDTISASNALTGSLSGLLGDPTPKISYGVVRKDTLRVWIAPNLEERKAPNNNAFENLKYPKLNRDRCGKGKENIIFKNDKYNDGTNTIYCWNNKGDWSIREWEKTGNALGRYYSIIGPGSGTAKLAGVYDAVTQIYTLDPEFQPLTEILTDITTGTYTPKTGNALVDIPISVSYNPITGELTKTIISLSTIPSGSGYFEFDSTGICNTLKSEIATLESEIETLRVGLSTYLEPPNSLKSKKHSEQLKMWSLKRVEVENEEKITQIGISTNAIVGIDSSLPSGSNTFDDGVLTTFDSGQITFDTY